MYMYMYYTKPVSKDGIVPAVTMKWTEPLCLIQREPEISSVEYIPLTSLEEKPAWRKSSKINVSNEVLIDC